LVSIGKILRSQGKDGELKLKLYIKGPEYPFFFKDIPQEERVVQGV